MLKVLKSTLLIPLQPLESVILGAVSDKAALREYNARFCWHKANLPGVPGNRTPHETDHWAELVKSQSKSNCT